MRKCFLPFLPLHSFAGATAFRASMSSGVAFLKFSKVAGYPDTVMLPPRRFSQEVCSTYSGSIRMSAPLSFTSSAVTLFFLVEREVVQNGFHCQVTVLLILVGEMLRSATVG